MGAGVQESHIDEGIYLRDAQANVNTDSFAEQAAISHVIYKNTSTTYHYQSYRTGNFQRRFVDIV